MPAIFDNCLILLESFNTSTLPCIYADPGQAKTPKTYTTSTQLRHKGDLCGEYQSLLKYVRFFD